MDLKPMSDGATPLRRELGRLVEDLRAGRLDARGDLAGLDPDAAASLALVNEALEILVQPLRMASGSLAQIAAGTIPEFVIDEYRGEFNEIKRNINTFLATMHGMHQEAQCLIQAVKEGRLRARGNDWDFTGAWARLIAGMNEVVESFERPFEITSRCVQDVSRGSMSGSVSVRLKGDYGRLVRDLNLLLGNLGRLTASILALSRAAVAGRLEERIGSEPFQGDWRRMVESLNATLDAALAPVREASAVLEQVAAYDLSARMDGDYAGDHARVKTALNKTAETLNQALLQVAATVEHVATGGAQIATASRAQADGATRQMGAVEDIVARLEALARQATENAERTERARQAVAEVEQAARSGKEAADRAAGMLAEIHEAATSSTAIIGEIDRVAATTNELAVTAGVEAAAVARSGRGFAVVASEVGRLAQRAKVATTSVDEAAKRLLGDGAAHDQEATSALERGIRDLLEIAQGTRMLSINAAIEAEHVAAASKGFEGVTALVKDLAQQSKDAAQKTEALTKRTLAAASRGTEVSCDLDAGMERAIEAAALTASLIEEIAVASHTQQEGVEAVAAATASIEAVSKANAESAAGSTGVADGLVSETSELSAMVGRFRLARA